MQGTRCFKSKNWCTLFNVGFGLGAASALIGTVIVGQSDPASQPTPMVEAIKTYNETMTKAGNVFAQGLLFAFAFTFVGLLIKTCCNTTSNQNNRREDRDRATTHSSMRI